MPQSTSSPAGSKLANLAASASRTSTWPVSNASIQRSTASSPSPATTPSRKQNKPTPKSLPDTIEARSTAFPGAPRTFSTPPEHPHHLGCRALPQSCALGGRNRRQTSQRCRRRADRQAESRCAGAQRYLVRRPNHEPVAAGRRIIWFKCGPGCGHRRRAGGFRCWQRDRRQHRSPTMRCGVTGLRPTYGRVPRTGAMTLCWSLDKLGPMTRSLRMQCWCCKPSPGPTAATSPAYPASWNTTQDQRCGPARWLLPRLDEGEPRPPTSTAPPWKRSRRWA